MRIISRFLIPVILVSLAATLPTIVHSKEPEIVRIPQKSNLSCDGAIEAVKQDLKKRGIFSESKLDRRAIKPRVVWGAEPISNFYYGYPSNRLKSVMIIGLSTENRRSPIPFTAMGAQIMAACDQVGLVDFNHKWEGVDPVGYFPDRTARLFKRVEGRSDEHQRIEMGNGSERTVFEWGYYSSP